MAAQVAAPAAPPLLRSPQLDCASRRLKNDPLDALSPTQLVSSQHQTCREAACPAPNALGTHTHTMPPRTRPRCWTPSAHPTQEP